MDFINKDFLFEDRIQPFLFEGVNEDIVDLFRMFQEITKLQMTIIGQVAKEFDIYQGQLFCLKVIDSRPYISQSDLAKKLNLRRATITSTLKNLENKDLIERLTDKQDHRTLRITLTTQGKEIVCKTNKKIADQLNEWYSDLSKEEVEKARGINNKIVNRLLICSNIGKEV